jgi:hypothetical protein
MLVSDIVRRVRESVGDSAVLQFSNATLTDWINDAVRECVQTNSLLQAKAEAATVVNQKTYTLPGDIFKIHSVLVDTTLIELLSLNEFEAKNYDLTRKGDPTVGCIYAGKLDLYPTPDKIKPIYVNYTKTPKEVRYINDGTNEGYSPNSVEIPVAFHNRIVTYCLAQVALQDDDYMKYQAMMQEFTTGVVDLQHLKNQTESVYPSITYVEWE